MQISYNTAVRALSTVSLILLVGSALPSYVYVDASMGASGDGTTTLTAFKTVTEGLSAAGTGDTVRILPGTYSESVTYNKSNVTLEGTDSANRPLITNGITISGGDGFAARNLHLQPISSSARVINNSPSNFQGFLLDNVEINVSTTTNGGVMGSSIGGVISITNSQFYGSQAFATLDTGSGGTASVTSIVFANNLVDGCQGHIAFRSSNSPGYPNVTITSNTIRNTGTATNSFGGIIKVFGGNNVVIADNAFSDIGTSGFNPAGEAAYGAAILVRDTTFLRLADNSFDSCNQGLAIEPSRPFPSGEISGNVFTGGAYGIYLPATTTAYGTTTISGNLFLSQTSEGIHNGGGTAITAENNWWGAQSGPNPPGTGTAISSNVDADPWVGAAGNTAAAYAIMTDDTPQNLSVNDGQCSLTLTPNSGQGSGHSIAAIANSGAATQGYQGFYNGLGLTGSVTVATDLADGTFVSTIRVGYDPTSLAAAGIYHPEGLSLMIWNAAANSWVPATGTNVSSGANNVGVSAPTGILGDYGVDTAHNFVWAVVDHHSQYAIGAGSSVAVPVSLSAFQIN